MSSLDLFNYTIDLHPTSDFSNNVPIPDFLTSHQTSSNSLINQCNIHPTRTSYYRPLSISLDIRSMTVRTHDLVTKVSGGLVRLLYSSSTLIRHPWCWRLFDVLVSESSFSNGCGGGVRVSFRYSFRRRGSLPRLSFWSVYSSRFKVLSPRVPVVLPGQPNRYFGLTESRLLLRFSPFRCPLTRSVPMLIHIGLSSISFFTVRCTKVLHEYFKYYFSVSVLPMECKTESKTTHINFIKVYEGMGHSVEI